MIPQYERPKAPVDSHYPVKNQSESKDVAANIAWQDFFVDDRLKKIIELALVNNRDLRVAMLNVEQSRAQYQITRSASFPSISAGASYTKSGGTGITTSSIGATISNSSATTNQWTTSLGITSYELDFFGRVRSLNTQALESYFATEEAQRSARITLVAEIANQYLTLRTLEQQLEVSRQTATALQESYRLNKVTFDAGSSNELDLRAAESQMKTAKFNTLTYERQLAQAENALVLLVGQSLPEKLPPSNISIADCIVSEIPAGLPSDLVERRPDILQAEHTLIAANANIGAARAAFFPSISLTASVGTASTQLSQLFSAGAGTWSFSPQISLPIFTGGKNTANLESAKVGQKIAVANYEKTIQTAFHEVADALVASKNYSDQISVETDAIQSLRRRLEIANLRYRAGSDSYLNVLTAQQDLYSAQQTLLTTQLSKLSNQISLYKALGGGWK
jgi:multidrug efflux system outer membrane protein